MLNSFFAFGVPTFLVILYIGFAIFRKKSQIPYLGFALFIIAGFLSAFSFQVIQEALTELQHTTQQVLEQTYGYPFYLLAIPFACGILLLVLNAYRGYKRIKTIRYQAK
ncbi:hypothetical protein IV487_11740 [Enterococcus saccharolyticus]|uniref:Branched-chain amino acid transport system carrier protein n=1 Tax=Candidatus Enterococcus willemsii TaxID=1857215 RepID=A0ABQ6YVX5_9ENTE|nr:MULTISPECIES: hypothetical protein [Enterococcus]KAF1301485.1 hypothetical protein BAU17_06065 [Enterococcus sp. CU12B]MCD5003135.1 hypothetical protein [Enterococcus saccharolyticus]